jgi:competence protein ComGC
MKKLRLAVRISIVILVILSIIGIVILIANENLNWLDTSYEIIAFTLGASGMIMAVLSEIDSYTIEKSSKKMVESLTQLNREADEDDKVDREFQKKLDKILALEGKIYKKLRKK